MKISFAKAVYCPGVGEWHVRFGTKHGLDVMLVRPDKNIAKLDAKLINQSLARELEDRGYSKQSVCADHEWPYGVDLEGDNRPLCVWCEALRADALERKVVELENQLKVAENLLLNATPNPKFLTMGYQTKWANEFGKWWAERKHGK